MNYKDFCDKLYNISEEGMLRTLPNWEISKSLYNKITPDGHMKEFFGDTTVIRLSDRDINRCREVQDILLDGNQNLFVKIMPETFHITIHAFNNSNNIKKEQITLEQAVAKSEVIIKNEFCNIFSQYSGKSITMKSIGISLNPMKDVISIKFIPSHNIDYKLIIDLFNRFEAIHPLNCIFVPHVSLAYFKLQKYTMDEVKRLHDRLIQLNNRIGFEVELDIGRLAYQHHSDMNNFTDIFKISDLV